MNFRRRGFCVCLPPRDRERVGAGQEQRLVVPVGAERKGPQSEHKGSSLGSRQLLTRRSMTATPWWRPPSFPSSAPLGKMQTLVLLLASVGTCLDPLVVAATGPGPVRPDSPGMLRTHQRQKRDWIWNQMHIDEEKNTSLPHYVGKVRLGPQSRCGISSRWPAMMVAAGQLVTHCPGCQGAAGGCEGNGGRADRAGGRGHDTEGKGGGGDREGKVVPQQLGAGPVREAPRTACPDQQADCAHGLLGLPRMAGK